ncbi:hypothetical protein ABZ477_08920 [Microbacterium sp. NPDC019599]|uniref:hypothetical protein n=1 Tax=Microbacterium sp. NPDC019599 TaxID=3154690 RepID=UPI003411CD5F
MTVLDVLNTIFAGFGALAAVAGAFIAFAALRISMTSRAKADAAADADRRTRAAVADALDLLEPAATRPSLRGDTAPGGSLAGIAERLRRGE